MSRGAIRDRLRDRVADESSAPRVGEAVDRQALRRRGTALIGVGDVVPRIRVLRGEGGRPQKCLALHVVQGVKVGLSRPRDASLSLGTYLLVAYRVHVPHRVVHRDVEMGHALKRATPCSAYAVTVPTTTAFYNGKAVFFSRCPS